MNNIEKIISKTLIELDISHEEFTLMVNEQNNFFRPKESIREEKDHVDDIERDRLMEHGKMIGQNAKQCLNIKSKV